MKATIEIFLKNKAKSLRLTLPENYRSEQWLAEVCETLEDADEILHVQFQAAGKRDD